MDARLVRHAVGVVVVAVVLIGLAGPVQRLREMVGNKYRVRWVLGDVVATPDSLLLLYPGPAVLGRARLRPATELRLTSGAERVPEGDDVIDGVRAELGEDSPVVKALKAHRHLR